MKRCFIFAIALTSLAISIEVGAATFSIRVTDGASEGLNDPTSFAPVGGNTATTLGQARMNVLREAARAWGSLLQSNVPILVDASFDSLTCSATSGTLGSAGPRSMYRNFGGGVSPDVYYVSALADAISSVNQSSSSSADIVATFNSSVDGDAACLGGRGFYYGLDHNRGTKIDLLLVVLHEFGHGLGFTSQVDLSTGKGQTGSDGVERFDSFTHQIYDEQFNGVWPTLSDAQRVQSTTHTCSLAWNGANVNAQIGRFSRGFTVNGRGRLYAPATVSSGSSVSHFDTAFTPNVLMEPNLSSSITTSSTDITVCALQDIGWTVTICPHFSNNRPPTSNAQSITTMEDTPITIILTGSDPDNDPLTYSIATSPALGTLSAISTSHTVIYTPSANANGADSFTFTVSDGVATSTATVNIAITPVNDAPTAMDLAVIANTGQATNIALVGNDVDGDPLTYSIVSPPTHGTLSGTGANVSYRSADGFVGTDSFTYRVNDGTLSSNVATATITVQNAPQVSAALGSSSSGGGGGAFAYFWLALIALLTIFKYAPRSMIRRGL